MTDETAVMRLEAMQQTIASLDLKIVELERSRDWWRNRVGIWKRIAKRVQRRTDPRQT